MLRVDRRLACHLIGSSYVEEAERQASHSPSSPYLGLPLSSSLGIPLILLGLTSSSLLRLPSSSSFAAESQAAEALQEVEASSARATDARVKAHDALLAAIAEGQQQQQQQQQREADEELLAPKAAPWTAPNAAPGWRRAPQMQSAPPYPGEADAVADPSHHAAVSADPNAAAAYAAARSTAAAYRGASAPRRSAPTTAFASPPTSPTNAPASPASPTAAPMTTPGAAADLARISLPARGAAAGAAARAAAPPSAYGQRALAAGGMETSLAWQRAAAEGEKGSAPLIAEGSDLLRQASQRAQQGTRPPPDAPAATRATTATLSIQASAYKPAAVDRGGSFAAESGPTSRQHLHLAPFYQSVVLQRSASAAAGFPSVPPTHANSASAASTAQYGAFLAATDAKKNGAQHGGSAAALRRPPSPAAHAAAANGKSAGNANNANASSVNIQQGTPSRTLQRPASAHSLRTHARGGLGNGGGGGVSAPASPHGQYAYLRQQQMLQQPPFERAVPSTVTFSAQGFAYGAHHAGAAKAPPHQRQAMGLGVDVLGPLWITDSVNEPLVARPKSERADREGAEAAALVPRDTLQKEPKGGDLWMRREERVASSLRSHVSAMRAVSGGNSKSALLARRKAAAAHYGK